VDNFKIRAVAFLFGAGASVRLGYPMVTDFFSQFKGGNGSQTASSHLARYIAILNGGQVPIPWPHINAEEVFALAEQMRGVERALAIDDGGAALVIGKVTTAGQLYDRLCAGIVDIYGRAPGDAQVDDNALADALEIALEWNAPGSGLWLFTTNYDTVIEDSVSRWIDRKRGYFALGKLVTGFGERQPHRFKEGLFRQEPPEGEWLVRLLKLHGSANWKRETADPRSAAIETGMRGPTNHDCVLYFGYKTFPESQPFLALHRLFRQALLQPITLVSVGFQFGDPYIRELVDFALDANPSLRVICCLKDEPSDGSSVRELMKRHAMRFELLRNPAGALVPFGDQGFRAALNTAVQSAVRAI
jgi:hypothetical protein